MFQQFYEPHPALKGFVNNIMIHPVEFDTAKDRPNFSIPPLPEHCLFFYVRDRSNAVNTATRQKETLSSSVIVGPHTSRHLITPGCDHLMIKVGFQPAGLYRFLGIPMKELLCNDSFNSIDLLGNEIKEVDDRLMHAATFFEMKTIIETFLLKRSAKLKQALPIDQLLPILLKNED